MYNTFVLYYACIMYYIYMTIYCSRELTCLRSPADLYCTPITGSQRARPKARQITDPALGALVS